MRNKKKIIIIVMLIAVFIMAIGYAAFSTTLKITGTANIVTVWDVQITRIESVDVKGGATNAAIPTYTATTASFEVDLVLPGDEMTYEIDITNNGDLDAEVRGATYTINGSEDIYVKVSGIQKGTVISNKSCTGTDCNKATMILKIGYDPLATAQATVKSKTIEITLNIGQYAPGNPVEGGELIPELNEVPLVTQILRDNIVQSDADINFSAISSDTNGKGLYYTTTNTEDNKMTYYFRGAVTNNYVYFAGFYWRVVRINEDGSVRLIYQGTTPTASGSNASIGSSAFNTHTGDSAFLGYMYGTPTTYSDGSGTYSGWAWSSTTGTVKMATAYTFNSSTGAYTLTNPIDGYYTADYYGYYTCMSASQSTCNFMMKMTEARMSGSNYQLWAGETHSAYFSTSYAQATTNTQTSAIKKVLDSWYSTNLTSYASYLSDSGFCNDRSIASGLGYGHNTSFYGARNRLYVNKTPQFSCSQQNDLFTVSNAKGNTALTYPIGLLTADEVAYAGGVNSTSNNSYYLYTGAAYFTMSAFHTHASYGTSNEWYVTSGGQLNNGSVTNSYNVRPVINLIPKVEITGGSGTSSDPYVIKTS